MKALKFSTVLLLLLFTQIGRADPLDTWTERSPLPRVDGLSAVTYGNNQFVAVGAGWDGNEWYGTIVPSPGGVMWTNRSSVGIGEPSSIAYGNGHFVAVGDNGTILESGPLINLSLTPNSDSGLLLLSLEGPTGLDYTIQTSTDLVSWHDVTKITSAQSGKIILDELPVGSGHTFYRAYSQ